MSTGRWFRGAALLSLTLLGPLVRPAAAERLGGLAGWVEDTRGVPVAGAVISLFGKGLAEGGRVTLSDRAGRFFLSSLPPGSYTLRALGPGHLPAPARRITVLPDQEAIFAVSLIPLTGLSESEAQERARELRWLVRHHRRSILESQGPVVIEARRDAGPSAPRLPDLGGTLEVVARPPSFGPADAPDGADSAASQSLVRLEGRLADNILWSVGGVLAESDSAAWRMASEIRLDPGAGHEIRAGGGYGAQALRPSAGPGGVRDTRSVGALFVEDRWTRSAVSATAGLRYSCVSYLKDGNYVDPSAALELRRADGATIRAAFSTHTLVPGGDLLTLSSLSSLSSDPGIALAVMDTDLRPERLVHYELSVDRTLGANTFSARTFYETTRDQLANSFVGPRVRSLHIFNARGLAARGVGLTLAHRFGGVARGSVSYTYGRSWRGSPLPVGSPPALAFGEGDFHDVVARFETGFDRSDTRFVAFYRVNTLTPDTEGVPAVTSTRFDIEVRQGLPMLGDLTRAEWELLLAYRNLFYETTEGGVLDEVAVLNPPKRMLGGISVRF